MFDFQKEVADILNFIVDSCFSNYFILIVRKFCVFSAKMATFPAF